MCLRGGWHPPIAISLPLYRSSGVKHIYVPAGTIYGSLGVAVHRRCVLAIPCARDAAKVSPQGGSFAPAKPGLIYTSKALMVALPPDAEARPCSASRPGQRPKADGGTVFNTGTIIAFIPLDYSRIDANNVGYIDYYNQTGLSATCLAALLSNLVICSAGTAPKEICNLSSNGSQADPKGTSLHDQLRNIREKQAIMSLTDEAQNFDEINVTEHNDYIDLKGCIIKRWQLSPEEVLLMDSILGLNSKSAKGTTKPSTVTIDASPWLEDVLLALCISFKLLNQENSSLLHILWQSDFECNRFDSTVCLGGITTSANALWWGTSIVHSWGPAGHRGWQIGLPHSSDRRLARAKAEAAAADLVLVALDATRRRDSPILTNRQTGEKPRPEPPDASRALPLFPPLPLLRSVLRYVRSGMVWLGAPGEDEGAEGRNLTPCLLPAIDLLVNTIIPVTSGGKNNNNNNNNDNDNDNNALATPNLICEAVPIPDLLVHLGYLRPWEVSVVTPTAEERLSEVARCLSHRVAPYTADRCMEPSNPLNRCHSNPIVNRAVRRYAARGELRSEGRSAKCNHTAVNGLGDDESRGRHGREGRGAGTVIGTSSPPFCIFLYYHLLYGNRLGNRIPHYARPLASAALAQLRTQGSLRLRTRCTAAKTLSRQDDFSVDKSPQKQCGRRLRSNHAEGRSLLISLSGGRQRLRSFARHIFRNVIDGHYRPKRMPESQYENNEPGSEPRCPYYYDDKGYREAIAGAYLMLRTTRDVLEGEQLWLSASAFVDECKTVEQRCLMHPAGDDPVVSLLRSGIY